MVHNSQDLKGKAAFTKLVYNVEIVPKIFLNISTKTKGENTLGQIIHGSTFNDFIDLEKGHYDEEVDPTPIHP